MAFDLIAKEDEVSLINIEYSQDLSFLLPESAYQSRRGSRRYLGPNCLALDMVKRHPSCPISVCAGD
jgi:hypothetical protein